MTRNEIKKMELENRIKKLSEQPVLNVNLIKKAQRKLRKLFT